MVKQALSVGEVAKRSGVAVSTLHFYEQKGLITASRNNGNQRRYSRHVLRRVAVIKAAQQIGISLSEIRAALATLPTDKSPNADDWAKLSAQWRQHLDQRIKHLSQIRDELNECIGCGCLSLLACPLRNPQDKLGEEGSGARLLEQKSTD